MTGGSGRGTAKELEISSDGKRGYVLYAQSSKMSVLDLDAGAVIADVTTGRGGVKFGKFLAAVAASAASYGAASSAASSSGGGVFFYSVYTVRPANTAVVLSADEKFVYVLNTNSNDVTIVDTGTREVVTKIGVGGAANRLELLPGGAFVAVTTGADTLHLIDTRTNAKVSELPDGGNYLHSPDKRYAAAIGKNLVYCLDGASLKTLGKATGFKKPVQLLFEYRVPCPCPCPSVSVVVL
jgi:YVTN family beta-propeller protein